MKIALQFGSTSAFALFILCAISQAQDYGQFAKWTKIEIAFEGDASQAGGMPNPFAVRLDVNFESPSGQPYRVPGFYDGDGQRNPDGNIWKVRFSADELGQWTFSTSSDQRALDGQRGRFTTVAPQPAAQGFWRYGRLEAVGNATNQIRYLKFRDGSYWLKAGCDDPENFLGRSQNFDTLAKRKAAIDYLADQGINSLYIITHNIQGDDNDVWPWLGNSPQEAIDNGANDVRFDVSKLDEWRELFEYMQDRGVVPYLVLEDDGAWKDYDHARYYREMIARFGYLPALTFNCGEEHNENYELAQALNFMDLLQWIDPYDHPRGIHNVNQPNDRYVQAPCIDFTSIQTGSPGTRTGLENALEHNSICGQWIDACSSGGQRILVVNFDEARPEEDRRGWWSVYIGGGVWESHVLPPFDRPFAAEEPMWAELGGARAFMESLPFWEMQPHNELVTEGRAFCLAKPGEVYACYLPVGGSATLQLPPDGTFKSAWWNPANGKTGQFVEHKVIVGGARQFVAPSEGDWVLRIERQK